MSTSAELENTSYAEFENATDRPIALHIDWDDGAASFNTIIPPGEVVEVSGFNGKSGTACHRDDGGAYTNCPQAFAVRVSAGDYVICEANGGYQG